MVWDDLRGFLKTACGIFAALVLVSGCGGDNGDNEPTPTVTLTEMQTNIFSVSCTGSACHQVNGQGWMQTGGTNNGLDLSSKDAAYASLVGAGGAGIASAEITTMLRVAPDDPDNSYLIWKLECRPGILPACMPQAFPFVPLDPAQIDDIRTWITEGAQNN